MQRDMSSSIGMAQVAFAELPGSGDRTGSLLLPGASGITMEISYTFRGT